MDGWRVIRQKVWFWPIRGFLGVFGPWGRNEFFWKNYFYSAQLDMKIQLAAKFQKKLMDGYRALVRTIANFTEGLADRRAGLQSDWRLTTEFQKLINEEVDRPYSSTLGIRWYKNTKDDWFYIPNYTTTICQYAVWVVLCYFRGQEAGNLVQNDQSSLWSTLLVLTHP